MRGGRGVNEMSCYNYIQRNELVCSARNGGFDAGNDYIDGGESSAPGEQG